MALFRRILILCLTSILSISISAAGSTRDLTLENGERIDYISICELLDTSPIGDAEGIWHHSADDLTLIILRDRTPSAPCGDYGVYVLESSDCRLYPGCRIGTLTESVEKGVFSLKMFSKWKKGVLSNPLKCRAKLSADKSLMSIEGGGLSLRITPSVILPRLFDLLRLGIRIKVNNPAERIPDGWRKIYPALIDGGAAAPHLPLYL